MTEIKRLDKFLWEIPRHNEMRVPARLYIDESMVKVLQEEEKTDWSSLRQLKNVACLPGIQKYALALADVHPGYGAPIGGVGAFDVENGVITFALIGFDINCGVRTLTTPLSINDLATKEKRIKLTAELFHKIPAGLGSKGEIKLSLEEVDEVLAKGSKFALEQGYGIKEDLEFTEENGCIMPNDPSAVSIKAKQRQYKQIGTLGSGNHYLEVQIVEEIYDAQAAETFGLFQNQIVITFHCGSRGLGHQIGMDYLPFLEKASRKYNIKIRDKELVCAPFQSEEGQQYWKAVNCGINTAFANRQVICHLTRKVLCDFFGLKKEEVKTLYDVGHNTVKLEEHVLNGEKKKLLVHRKGSTRGFGPNSSKIPEKYAKVGQPIMIGGTMGTHSYILKGTQKAMEETFGSTIHGAGRRMSRHAALKQFRGSTLMQQLEEKGIIVRGHSMRGLAEEAPQAYKDIDKVINVMHSAGISTKVAKLKPIICIKG